MCGGRRVVYGYYADQDNDCQIFHICVPMQQLFPDLYDAEDIYQFSFICPAYTIFTQDAMVCAWVDSAFPCSEAHHLYDRNNNFFVVPAEEVYREAPVSTTTTTTTTTTASTTTTSTRKPVSRPFWTYFRSTLASSPKPTTQFTPTVNQPITPQIELLPPPSTLPPETTPQEPSTTLLP
ncbi:U-scoloptoxin(01)-Er1a-like 10 [Homarus americanus]|uniref:U-scoloptoxin(01)-Er1a-like 10 n=1 Tax=Homarus americanus TaxID=6706 RepID=A0A8J5JL29_HOMAM|nr:U-scoloptoxin(01)-Er1a-like 10 [Homarus americanus]